MIHTNTGTTIPAKLTDAPTAYKDGVTDALCTRQSPWPLTAGSPTPRSRPCSREL